MFRTSWRTLVAGATLVLALAAPGVARADVIGEWNEKAQAEAVLIRPTAHGQARGMAMVQGAVYDAVNAIVRTHQPYLLDPKTVDVQPFVSQDAAVATAAHHEPRLHHGLVPDHPRLAQSPEHRSRVHAPRQIDDRLLPRPSRVRGAQLGPRPPEAAGHAEPDDDDDRPDGGTTTHSPRPASRNARASR